MSTKSTRGKAAPKTADVTAPAVEATEATGSPADLAPLEPPTDEPAAAEQVAQEEKPAEGETPDADADAGASPAEEEVAAPPLAAPTSVQLEAPTPPAPVADEDADEDAPITINEHAVKELEHSYAELTDKHGNLIDPDSAFSQPHASGQVQCFVRIIKQEWSTEHSRLSRKLLLGAGVWVPINAAEEVKRKLREVADKAAEQA